MIVDMNPLKAGYKPEQLQGLYQQIEDKFHAMPGVEHVGLTLYTPLSGDIWSFYAYVQGQRAPDPGQDASTLFNRASPEYFKAVGQQVLRGRTFTPADTATSPGVAVVNQAFVKKLFKHGEDPLGKHFGVIDIKNSGDFEIVGVVEDTKYQSARDQPEAMFFAPMLQSATYEPAKGSGFVTLCGTVCAAYEGHDAGPGGTGAEDAGEYRSESVCRSLPDVREADRKELQRRENDCSTDAAFWTCWRWCWPLWVCMA